MKTRSFILFSVGVLCTLNSSLFGADKLKALILDGQNNHDWRSTTPVIKAILEDSGRFSVEVSTSPEGTPKGPKPVKDGTPEQKAAYETQKAKWEAEKKEYEAKKGDLWKAWRPNFQTYDVVVSNYNGDLWPDEVQNQFVDYVKNGGGFVSVHAANNAFPEWLAYNEIIGLGGWGGRSERSGPMLRVRDGKVVRDESPGAGGTHGVQHEFVVESVDGSHPILKGFPTKWKHAADELYAKLRGPAKNLSVLASAFSAPETKGTGENEPLLMVVQFGKGRVFHTALGHSVVSMSSVGFQSTLARGCEWAATGKVSLPLPAASELSADSVSVRELKKP